MRRPLQLWVAASLPLLMLPSAQADLTQGISSFEHHRWIEATGQFLAVLEQDPRNARAREYLLLSVKQIQSLQKERNRELRTQILSDAARRLENNRLDPTPLQQALERSAKNQTDAAQALEQADCLTALMEQREGNLAAANDMILRVIDQHPGHQEAQRILSDLQVATRNALAATPESSPERAALEGFYEYGQGNYEGAAAAWGRTRGLLAEKYTGEELDQRIAALRFQTFDEIARKRLDEEHDVARVHSLFADGLKSYEAKDFNTSLDAFRQVALANPDYPQLGFYLVKSEAAVQRQRTSDLSESKREEARDAFARGVANLDNGSYADAKGDFEQVLALDPAHPQARQYLKQIETQKAHRTDPEAAQVHYETGLVAYASGDQADAVREWHIALRMDPDHQKSMVALRKVERETQIAKDLP